MRSRRGFDRAMAAAARRAAFELRHPPPPTSSGTRSTAGRGGRVPFPRGRRARARRLPPQDFRSRDRSQSHRLDLDAGSRLVSVDLQEHVANVKGRAVLVGDHDLDLPHAAHSRRWTIGVATVDHKVPIQKASGVPTLRCVPACRSGTHSPTVALTSPERATNRSGGAFRVEAFHHPRYGRHSRARRRRHAAQLRPSGIPAAGPPGATAIRRRIPGGFKHLVVIYEENHSFDNLYGAGAGQRPARSTGRPTRPRARRRSRRTARRTTACRRTT